MRHGTPVSYLLISLLFLSPLKAEWLVGGQTTLFRDNDPAGFSLGYRYGWLQFTGASTFAKNSPGISGIAVGAYTTGRYLAGFELGLLDADDSVYSGNAGYRNTAALAAGIKSKPLRFMVGLQWVEDGDQRTDAGQPTGTHADSITGDDGTGAFTRIELDF